MTRAKYRRLELQIRMSHVVTNQQNTRLPHLAPEVREGFDRRGYKFDPRILYRESPHFLAEVCGQGLIFLVS